MLDFNLIINNLSKALKMHFNSKTCNIFLKPHMTLLLMKMKLSLQECGYFSKTKMLNLIFRKPGDNSLKCLFVFLGINHRTI